MAAWDALTQADRDAIIQLQRSVRDQAGAAARLGNLSRAIAAKYSGNVETILSGLDEGTIPAYDAGRGEEPLTKAQLVTLVGYAIDFSATSQGQGAPTSYNTDFHRSLYVQAAGLYNTLQQGQG